MVLEDLKAIISSKKVKQKEICSALNLSQSYTSELLSGKKEFSVSQLEQLCDFLNIDIKLIDKYR